MEIINKFNQAIFAPEPLGRSHFPAGFAWNPQEKVVKLIHASVSDFLRVGLIATIQPPDEFRIDPEKVNYEIAQRCLTQIETSYSDSDRSDLSAYHSPYTSQQSHTFFSYAAYFWIEHAKSCGKYIERLFDPQNSFFKAQDDLSIRSKWCSMYYHHWRGENEIINVPVLHMCSALGFLPWVHRVLQGPKSEGNNVYDEDGAGYTAL